MRSSATHGLLSSRSSFISRKRAGRLRSYETDVPPKPDANRNQSDPLGDFDAIILGDVGSAEVSSELWARLEAFVAERGGTLILSAGPRSWAALAHHETARKLLPVTDLHVVAAGDATR